jgi:hypothetical protein
MLKIKIMLFKIAQVVIPNKRVRDQLGLVHKRMVMDEIYATHKWGE